MGGISRSAFRFFFVKTLKRPYLLEDIPYPKVPRRLPMILTVEEVRVVTSLELVEHRVSKMGHRNLLVTHTLPD